MGDGGIFVFFGGHNNVKKTTKMEDIEIDFFPSLEDVNEIKNWCEYWSSNYSTISQSFTDNDLIVAKYKNKIVSYFACRKNKVTIFISLAETKLEFRKKGIAEKILERIIEHYKNTEFKALYLYCSPKESQNYWKKVGFKYCPENYDENKVYMFKIFGDVMEIKDNSEKKPENYIEFWNSDSTSQTEKAKWFSKLEFNPETNELTKPILFFGNYHWQINIVCNTLNKKLRFKDFDKTNEIFDCIYITKINQKMLYPILK